MIVKETKVYQLFACLSTQERKDFSRFLATHSKPKRANLRHCLAFLCSRAAAIEDDKSQVSTEDWWREVFLKVRKVSQQDDLGQDILPAKEKISREMGKLQNAFVNDLEAFLVDRKLRKEADEKLASVRECEKLNLLLASLQERGQEALFWQYARKLDKLLATLPQDATYFRLRHQYGLLVIDQKQRSTSRASLEDFVDCKENLDRYHSLQTLLLLLGGNPLIPDQGPEKELFELECVQSAVRRDPKHSALALLMLDLLIPPVDYSIEEWDALLNRLKENAAILPKHLLIELANVLFNLARKQIGQGREEFIEAAWRWYVWVDAENVLSQIIKENPSHFLNLKMISMRRGDFSLYVKYKEYNLKCKDYISRPGHQVAECEFDIGLDHYYEKREFKLAKAAFLLAYSIANSKEKHMQYAAGIYVIRCQYELQEIDDMQDFRVAFRNRVNRDKKMKSEHKISYRMFLDVVWDLMKIHYYNNDRRDTKRRQKLLEMREKVTTTPRIISREWLLEKIDELL